MIPHWKALVLLMGVAYFKFESRPLPRPLKLKRVFYCYMKGVQAVLDIQWCMIPHLNALVLLMGVAYFKFVSLPLPRPLKLKRLV